jgi:4'-phosphopantetheinyl transferase EntD
MMNESGKSDSPIVPKKSPNKVRKRAAGAMEERGLAKGNLDKQNAFRAHGRICAHSALDRVGQALKRDRRQRFTALFHHVYSIDQLR